MLLLRRAAALAVPLGLTVAVAQPAHAAIAAVATDIHISEAGPNGGKAGSPAYDYIELSNTGAQDEDVSGWVLRDDKDADNFTLPAGSVIAAGGYLSFNVGDASLSGSFGLGTPADAARLYLPDGTTLVDQLYWTAANSTTGNGWSRCVSSSGAMGVIDAPVTPGAADTCPTPAAVTTTIQGQVKVNEVLADGATPDANGQQPDWIELYNGGPTTLDLSGYYLSDNKAADRDVLPAHTSIAPGGFLKYAVGVTAGTFYAAQDPFIGVAGDVDFGLGKSGDHAALVFPGNPGADVDRFSWVAAWQTGTTMGRCPDGSANWQLTFTPTPAASNICGNPADTKIKVNEVDVAGGKVELTNTGATTYDVSGWLLKNQAGAAFTVPAGSTIAPGAFTAYAVGGAFTLGSADTVSLLDGTNAVDSYAWTAAPATSYGRCPDGTGAFTTTHTITDGAANDCATGGTGGTGSLTSLRINEIETNGDPAGDWVELTNIGSVAVDAGGVVFRDNKDADGYAVPAGTVIAPGGFYKMSVTDFVFGLGAPDQARIFAPNGTTLIDSTSWDLHEAGLTYDRCPGATQGVVFTDTADSTPFVNSFTSTPNAANDCRIPIRINEVQASDPTAAPDWVELTNVGNLPVDIGGMQLTDDTDSHLFSVPSGTTLQPGSFQSYDVASAFGLGAAGDEVRLFTAGAQSGGAYPASKLVDSFVWEAPKQAYVTQTVTLPGGAWPANATYGRCPDGTGDWHVTTAAATGVSPGTKGSSNTCPGILTAQPWPGPQAVSTADNVDFGQNMSGLFYVPGATPAGDFMWGIENGDSGLSSSVGQSALFKLVRDANGSWGPAPGWTNGKAVHYANGAGQPDSEGVTAVGGRVYTASERDNTADTTSKVAVLEYDPSSGSSLTASREWDLEPDLAADPGLKSPDDANLGAEGLTFVPDSYLTAAGFKTDAGTTYDPSAYGDHQGGLFFVALEKTGKLYAYALRTDGSYSRVAVVSTGFPTIMDVAWDPSQDALWADCDNSCQGQTSIIAIDTNAASPTYGHFVPSTIYNRPTGAADNLNNEGFAFQPSTECVNGLKSAWWADDSDDGGHAIRTAQVACTPVADGHIGATITASLSTTAVPNGSTYAAPVTVTFTCHTLDAVLTTDCPAPVTLSNDGSNLTATGSVTDTLGKTYAATSSPVTIDTVVPTVTIDSSPTGWVAAGPQQVTFHPSESASYQCRVDGSAYAPCTSPWSPSVTADGVHHVDVRATDVAGNTGPAASAPINVDAAGPVASVGGVTAGATYSGVGPTPTCVATDAESGVAGCALTITRTPTSVKVVANAVDHVGNTSSTTVTYATRAVSLLGVTPVAGVWTLQAGKTYTLEVLTTSTTAPRYVGPSAVAPQGQGRAMTAAGVVNGVHVWTATVRAPLFKGTYYVGVLVGATRTVLTLKV